MAATTRTQAQKNKRPNRNSQEADVAQKKKNEQEQKRPEANFSEASLRIYETVNSLNCSFVSEKLNDVFCVCKINIDFSWPMVKPQFGIVEKLFTF